jgi:Permeases of the drug/metabolite transporter (DMT) superfamily
MGERSIHVRAFLTIVLWASAYVVTKLALEHFCSPSLGFIRCAVASAALAAIVLARRSPPPRLRDLPWLFLSGALGFAVYLLVFNKGSETLNPTTSCLIISTAPIISAVLARLCFGEILSPARWGAIVLALAGVAVMVLRGDAPDFTRGALWMTAATLAISAYNILQRKLGQRYDPLRLTAYSFLAATVLLAPFCPEAAAELRSASPLQAGLAVFLGIFPSALAYQLWAGAIARADKVSTVTNYMFLTPFLTALMEYSLIRQAPEPRTVIGGGIIIGALLFFARAGRKR